MKGNQKFSYLLASLLLMFLAFPIVESSGRGNLVFEVFFSAILLSAVYAVIEKRRSFYFALFLAVPALATRWAGNFWQTDISFLVSNILSVVFLSVVVALILGHVLEEGRVTAQKIYGALSVYLLIGIIWALLFFVIDFCIEGSFRVDQTDNLTTAQMVYYSFITLTTLGYGDIVPTSALARSLASLEALVGQLYLAVLVARLVALHITHSGKDQAPRDG